MGSDSYKAHVTRGKVSVASIERELMGRAKPIRKDDSNLRARSLEVRVTIEPGRKCPW